MQSDPAVSTLSEKITPGVHIVDARVEITDREELMSDIDGEITADTLKSHILTPFDAGEIGATLLSVDIKEDGSETLWSMTVRIDDPELFASKITERYAQLWNEPEWSPESSAEAIFEAFLASNELPSPADMGFEIIDFEDVTQGQELSLKANAPKPATAAEKTFMGFIQRGDSAPAPVVVHEDDFQPIHYELIDYTKTRLGDLRILLSAGRLDDRLTEYESDRDDARFFLIEDYLLITSPDKETVIGGVVSGTIVIEEDHRGKGFARDLHVVCADNNLHIFSPGQFSTGGFASRVSAHKELCERSLDKGDPVHPENIEAYRLEPPKDITLYSAVAVKNLHSIKQEGLRAGSYFGTHEIAKYYAETIEDEGDQSVILRVSLSDLIEAGLEPDTNGIVEPLTFTLKTTEEAVHTSWEESRQGWRDCLKLIGSVRAKAAVPADLLKIDDDYFAEPEHESLSL